MRILFAGAAYLLLTAAAFAQANATIDPEMLPENRAIDQRYRNTLQRLPDGQESNDPWRKFRAVETESKPKPAGKKSN
ncbi:MAG TPA: hypothetical protein VNQ34_02500 [Xanthobacteraceae bacterium]|jgi:hypothetical protein|nr:hypothetical protein [Xanthobacteraceae bacterium]